MDDRLKFRGIANDSTMHYGRLTIIEAENIHSKKEVNGRLGHKPQTQEYQRITAVM